MFECERVREMVQVLIDALMLIKNPIFDLAL